MMEGVYRVISAAALLSAMVVAASVVAAIVKKWSAARELARLGVLTAVALVPVGVVLLLVSYNLVANADAASKATLLARGISTAMNCFAPIIPAVLAGIPVWVIATQRSRPKPELDSD